LWAGGGIDGTSLTNCGKSKQTKAKMKVLRGTFTGKSGQHKILLGFSKHNLSFSTRRNNLQKNTG
jgi:hypothetical protein